MSPDDRRNRDDEMRWRRAYGATIRQIARHVGLSKSRVHEIVADVAIVPPRPENTLELVRLPSGGYTARPGPTTYPRPRTYKVRDGKRVYPV